MIKLKKKIHEKSNVEGFGFFYLLNDQEFQCLFFNVA